MRGQGQEGERARQAHAGGGAGGLLRALQPVCPPGLMAGLHRIYCHRWPQACRHCSLEAPRGPHSAPHAPAWPGRQGRWDAHPRLGREGRAPGFSHQRGGQAPSPVGLGPVPQNMLCAHLHTRLLLGRVAYCWAKYPLPKLIGWLSGQGAGGSKLIGAKGVGSQFLLLEQTQDQDASNSKGHSCAPHIYHDNRCRQSQAMCKWLKRVWTAL